MDLLGPSELLRAPTRRAGRLLVVPIRSADEGFAQVRRLVGPIRCFSVAPRRFNHGLVRNELARQARAGLMAEIDLVAIPSLWDENHPMVACEASLARRPLLVSDRGGLPELVQDGLTGWVVGAGASEAWAEQLSLLAADPARVLRAQEALAAPRTAATMAAEFVGVYEGLVEVL